MTTLEQTIERLHALGPGTAVLSGVNVAVVRKFWDPGDKERFVAPHRDGMTAADCLPGDLDPALCSVAVNGEDIPPSRLAHHPVRPGDSVMVVGAPGLELGGPIGLIAKLILSGVVSALATKLVSQSPDSRSAEQKSVYGFSGIQTQYDVIGLPVPLSYGGPMDVGGLVIYESVKIVNGAEPETFHRAILLLGAGPIEAIGQYTSDQDGLTGAALPEGMTINGNNAQNFEDVTVSLRMGTRGQSVIPGFEQIETLYSVGLGIENTEDTSADPVVTDWSTAAVFDMEAGVTAEMLRVLIRFTGGLYGTGGGGIEARSVPFQMRYIELDGAGLPVGSYVDVDFSGLVGGSGTTYTVTAAQTAPFSHAVEFPVVDPDTYVPPAPGGAVQTSSSATRYGIVPIVNPLTPFWTFGGDIPELTVFGVINIQSSRTTSPMLTHRNGLNGIGWSIEFPNRGVGTKGGFIRFRWADQSNADTLETTLLADAFDLGAWHSFAVTVRPSGSSNLLVTLFKDGVLVAQTTSNRRIVHAQSGKDMLWGVADGNEASASAADFGHFTYDDLRIYKRGLTPSEIADLHNGGAWIEGDANETDLVWGSHFDSVLPAFGGISYFTGAYKGDGGVTWKPDLTHQPTEVSGVVLRPASGGTRNIRARVEVQRTSKVAKQTTRQDEATFDKLVTILDDEVAYVGWAIAAVEVRATNQLNTTRPQYRFSIKGRNDLPIWDGNDPEKPTFRPGFSVYPAWQLAGFCLDEKYGGGDTFTVRDFDWESLDAHAAWCATLVWDQKGRYTASQLIYNTNSPGFSGDTYEVRLPKPIPTQFVIGKDVRLSSVGDPEYPSGNLVIGAVVSIDSSTYALVFDWPDSVAAPPSVNPYTNASAAIVEGLRPRIACNLLLDERGMRFWDAVHLFTAVGRTSPSRLGNVMRLPINDVRQPVGVVGPSNIALETFRISSTRASESFSVAIGEINDEDLGFDRNAVSRSHPSLSGSSTKQRKVKTFDLRGVTSAAQARVELDLLLNLNQGDKLWVEFEGLLDSYFLEAGNVFALAFPLPWNRFGGRVQSDAPPSNVLDEPEDFTQWNVNANSDAALATATAPPFGDGTVYELSSSGSATGFPLWSRDVGVFLPDGLGQSLGIWVRETSSPSFELKLRDETAGVPYKAEFDWTAGVPVLDTATAGVFTKVTDGTTLTPPTAAGWYLVEMLVLTPIGVAGNNRRAYFYTPKTGHGGSWPNQAIEACYAMVQERTLGIVGGWARAQTIPIDIPITIEAGKSYSLACRNDLNDAVSVVAVDGGYPAGVLPAGTDLRLDEDLGFSPKAGAPWVFGESALVGALFQVTSQAQGQDFRCRIGAVTYADADYPDPDAIAGITATESAQALLGSGLGRPALFPGPPSGLKVWEESSRDPDSGTLKKAVYVSWEPDPDTAHMVARTNIWLRDETTEGTPDSHVGQVEGPGGFFRIPDAAVFSGTSYSVAVQEVTTSGERRSLRKAARVKFTSRAAFPVPPAPFDIKLHRIGPEIMYRWSLVGLEPNSFIEVRRGGIFVGDVVFVAPSITRQYGPTIDWTLMATDSYGVSSIPLFVRVVLPNGVKGPSYVVDSLDSPIPTQGEAKKELFVHDSGWAARIEPSESLPTLPGDAQAIPATDFLPETLAFADLSTATQFNYVSSTVTLDEPTEIHVSFAVEGFQLHPKPWEDFEHAWDSPEFASWTWEGPTDPNDPDFGECIVRTQVDWDDDEGGGSDGWERWTNGRIWAKVLKWRLQVVRPDDTWGVLVTRASLRVAELSPRTIDGGEL